MKNSEALEKLLEQQQEITALFGMMERRLDDICALVRMHRPTAAETAKTSQETR